MIERRRNQPKKEPQKKKRPAGISDRQWAIRQANMKLEAFRSLSRQVNESDVWRICQECGVTEKEDYNRFVLIYARQRPPKK